MTINQFQMTTSNRPYLIKKLEDLDPHVIWTVTAIERKKKSTPPQMRWMRGFAKDFGDHCGYTGDEMYDLFMYKFNPIFKIDPSTGEEIRMPGHFSPKDTKLGAEIQEHVQRWAAECGFYWDERVD